MRQRHHRAVRVELQLQHQVVGHFLAEGGAAYVPGEVVFLARVAADHLEIERQRHLRQHARQLAGADDQQAPARAEQCAQLRAVEFELLAARRCFQRDRATVQMQRARHQFVARASRQDLLDPVHRAQRLLHQAQVAAAGQAEARRLLLGDAVGDQRGFVDTLAGAHALDQVVLDAAARHRADHQAVAAQAQQRARRARRRAPGFDDRDQPHLVALVEPVTGLAQHLQIEAVHANAPIASGSTAAPARWPRPPPTTASCCPRPLRAVRPPRPWQPLRRAAGALRRP